MTKDKVCPHNIPIHLYCGTCSAINNAWWCNDHNNSWYCGHCGRIEDLPITKKHRHPDRRIS